MFLLPASGTNLWRVMPNVCIHPSGGTPDGHMNTNSGRLGKTFGVFFYKVKYIFIAVFNFTELVMREQVCDGHPIDQASNISM